MQFISLELKHYKRLLLGAIEKITLTPTAMIQIILGTNGSGKSSLMYEMSPLPANAQDFTNGGYKKVEILHKGSHYILTSTFDNGQLHSFIKDSVELNPGGTVTVQKELVEIEFGITQDIRALLIGEERFTRMTPAARRIWLTRLSETNYDYAISVYMKLKERHRDTLGALRQAKQRLVTETANAPKQAEMDKLKKEIEEIYSVIKPMMEQRSPVPKPSNVYKVELQSSYDTLIEKSKDLIELIRKRIDISRYKDYNSILEHLKQHEIAESNAQVQLTQFSKDYTENEEKLKLAQQAIDIDSKELLTEKKRLLEAIKKTSGYVTINLSVECATEALNALETVSDTLLEVYQILPSNESGKYTLGNYQKVQATVKELDTQCTTISNQLTKLILDKSTQEHHRDHDKTQCPQCQYSWSKGYNPEKYQSILKTIEELTKQHEILSKTLSEKKTEQEEIETYINVYRQYTKISQTFPVLKDYFNRVMDSKLLIENPRALINDLQAYKLQLKHLVELQKDKKELEEIDKRLVLAMKFSNTNTTGMKERHEYLQREIEKTTLSLRNAQKAIQQVRQCKNHFEKIQELKSLTEELSQRHDELYKKTISTLQQEIHNEVLAELQTLVSEKEKAYTAMLNHHLVLEDIEKQINTLKESERIAKIAVKEISPTDGLIAEGMLGFITIFTKQMNTFIKKIWTYPLKIHPCANISEDKVELDYRFPITVGNHKLKDISRGSTGIMEVIDLAFKVASMQFLGLSHSPLYLDEFAASFDKEHRVAANHAIKSLMDTKMFSQLFMISHYFEGYGLFNNAEVCVLDNRNITTPQVYNTHVKIE